MKITELKKWLSYWKNSLADADRKRINVSTHPLKVDAYYIDKIPKKHAEYLWYISRAKQDDTFIIVDISPCSFLPTHEHAKKKNGEVDVIYPFWIPAKMFKNGKLSPIEKPFFVRDYLSPNPKNFYTISSIKEVDKKLNIFDFNIDNWEVYWRECEKFFKEVTGKAFEEFNTEIDKKIYVEKGELRNVSQHIIKLYNQLTDDFTSQSLFKKLIGIAADKEQLLPDRDLIQYNLQHLGQMDNTYPLSASQRKSTAAYTSIKTNQIFAVNGPPGTGKTTLLQSIVANSIVNSVIENRPPDLIMASSANNNAIKNILNSFKFKAKSSFSERWLPDVSSLGLYFTSQPQPNYHTCTSCFGDGFIKDYENSNLEEKEHVYLVKYANHFPKVDSLELCMNNLRKEVIQKKKEIERLLFIANQNENIDIVLNTLGLDNIQQLETKIQSISNKANNANSTILNLETTEKKLVNANQELSFVDKVFFCLPNSIQRRKSAFQRAVLEVNFDNSINFSSFKTIKHKLNELIIEATSQRQQFKEELNHLSLHLEDFKVRISNYEKTLQTWDLVYGKSLSHLFSKTGDEYQKLKLLDDMNVRLDLSYRYEAFWLSLHYREAQYLLLLKEKNEKKNLGMERGLETYKSKLQRIACITPVFISTFYSLPKFATYYITEENPYFNLFDLLIVDEAGQVPPDISIPSFSLAKKAIIVGDVYQIEPLWSVEENIDIVNLINNGLLNSGKFEKEIETLRNAGALCSSGNLMRMAQNSCYFIGEKERGALLTEHRRCLDSIISYSNKYVYNNQLIPKKGNKADIELFLPSKGFLHINSISEKNGESRINKQDANIIAKWINENCNDLEKIYIKPIHEIIAIVTPYKAQAFEIKRNLLETNKQKFKQIITGTVHALQGAEMDIVLFSSVLSAADNPVFVNRKYNMLNVAISRAKHSFLIFGNMSILDHAKNSPLGNLKTWLVEDEKAELSNNIVYESTVIYDNKVKRISKLKEHVGTLRRSFEIAKKELFIVSPFISIEAIKADKIEELAKETLEKGVKITVITDSKLDLRNGSLKKHSLEGREVLKRMGVELKILDGIHNKTIIIDESILVEGSFNWLSAVRDTSNKYSRYETSIVVKGKEAIELIAKAKRELLIN